LRDFKALFVEVVQIARVAGLVSLGTLAVDGWESSSTARRLPHALPLGYPMTSPGAKANGT
jgi:hypothetical protein